MYNLYSFGCSHSTRIYFDNKNFCVPYNEHLANNLNLNLINLSQQACGNDFILNSFINSIKDFGKDDIVLIQLTHFQRNNFYDVQTKFKSFGSYHPFSGSSNFDNEINNSHLKIFEYTYPQTIINFFDLISVVENLKKCKIFIFAFEEWRQPYKTLKNEYPFWLQPYLNKKNIVLFGNEKFKSLGEYSGKYFLRSLKDAGEFEDGHMSSDSHKIVAELIYNYIKENE